VLLWVASNYGPLLDAPNCPPLLATSTTGSTTPTSSAGVREAPRFIVISFLLGAVLSQVL